MRSEKLNGLLSFIDRARISHMHRKCQSNEHRVRNNPETERDTDIVKEVFEGIPSSTDYLAQPHSRKTHSETSESKQNQLSTHGEQVESHVSALLGELSLLMC